jgi:hypothetical protein
MRDDAIRIAVLVDTGGAVPLHGEEVGRGTREPAGRPGTRRLCRSGIAVLSVCSIVQGATEDADKKGREMALS